MNDEELEKLEEDDELMEEYYNEQFEKFLDGVGDDSHLTIDDFDFGFEANDE